MKPWNATVLNARAGPGLAGFVLLVFLAGQALAAPEDHFVTTWNTENDGSSGSTSITIPMIGGPYEVDWNDDGTFDETVPDGSVTHDFGVAGVYTVRIRGDYEAIRFDNTDDVLKILSVDQWGTVAWKSMENAFWGARNLEIPATDTPDFSAVTNMEAMFHDAVAANPDTSEWDTSSVENMFSMFEGATAANPDTSGWETGAVTNMARMFRHATAANPDTSGWNTSLVEFMQSMFSFATVANPDTSGWNTGAVLDMSSMFFGADAANPDTSGWDTSLVRSMNSMFYSATAANPDTSGWETGEVAAMISMFRGATAANPDTSGWDTSLVRDMRFMFLGATAANPDTSGWNTDLVSNMSSMFNGATAADPDTSGWETGAVTNMARMFLGATAANPDTSGWDTSLVEDMLQMFDGATAANPDVSDWDTSLVEDMRFLFSGASAADPDTSGWTVQSLSDANQMFNASGLTTANYEALLEAWSTQTLQMNVRLGAASTYYCSESAETARASLIDDHQWLITDLGRGCTVGGEVSGLQGSGLTLQLNGGNDLPIAADGPFEFPGSLDNLSGYAVTVSVRPSNPSQTCTVTNGSGTLVGPNVSNVEVSCQTDPDELFADRFEQ